jgi:hypothetical protein
LFKEAMVGPNCPYRGAIQTTEAAGLRPPPSARLIDGQPISVNAFDPALVGEKAAKRAGKLLMRLYFRQACH